MCNTRKELRDFTSLYDLLDHFATEEICEEYLAASRWNGEPTCPYCKSKRVNNLKGKTKRYKCYGCRKQFGVRVGTIFHDSKLPLRKWYVGIYLICSNPKGISSYKLAEDLNIHQSSAWHLLHRVRETYLQKKTKLRKRTVELDETLYGGLEKNKHKDKKTPNNQGRSTKTKALIFGILERNGDIYAVPVKDAKGATLLPIVEAKVCKGSNIFTDEYKPYRSLRKDFKHVYVNHKRKEYVRGNCHTNGLENFWSHLKRGLSGTYHHVFKKHLERYVNEFTFRHNNRGTGAESKFNVCLSGSEQRLTYKALTSGKK
jgi:transposase-like protein